MKHALIVPVAVDFLPVDEHTPIAKPHADFTRLPYSGVRRDENPGRPFLAEEIVTQPFEEDSAWLRRGIHVHWTLPAALTRGAHVPNRRAVPEGYRRVFGVDFPKVPNRWLVRAPRVIRDDPLEVGHEWWVVESDYVHPEAAALSPDSASRRHNGVSYLLTREERDRLGGGAPYRHVGRQIRLSDWRPDDPDAQYLDGLTAMGWGHPTFAASYPNCWSLFGFRLPVDDWHAQDAVPWFGELYGWYARRGDDPFAAWVAEHDTWSADDLMAAFGWRVDQRRVDRSREASAERPAVPDDAQAVASHPPTLDRLLCAATWNVRIPLPLSDAARADPPRAINAVTLGSTGGEALAAHMAHHAKPTTTALLAPPGVPPAPAAPQARTPEALYEEALEAILMASRLDPDKADAFAKLREARHDKEFVAVPGGTVWTIRARSVGHAADAAHAPSAAPGGPPAAVVARLAELNRLQRQRDRLARQQDALSARLYGDWCKYLLCKYPSRDSRDENPDVDEVRRYIETHSLGRLEANFDEASRTTAAVVGLTETIVGDLAEADEAACAVRRTDIADWAGVAMRAASLHGVRWRSIRRAGRRYRRAAFLQQWAPERFSAVLEWAEARLMSALNDLVVGESVRWNRNLEERSAEPSAVALLGNRARATEAVDRIENAVFPRPDERRLAVHRAWFGTIDSRMRGVLRVQRNRAILELLFDGRLPVVPKARHELDVKPGPRFWRPRDPVLLLAGGAVRQSARHRRPERARGADQAAAVAVRVSPIGAEPGRWLAAALSSPALGDHPRTPVADALRGFDSREPPVVKGWTPSWHPILLDWKIDLYEEAGRPEESTVAQRVRRYASAYLTDRYRLRSSAPDLEASSRGGGTLPAIGHPRAYSGRSLLTPHATRELLDALGHHDDSSSREDASEFLLTVADDATALLGDDDERSRLQSVSLAGFNDTLLMHQALFPLPIADPLAFSESQEFARRVERAVGRHTRAASRPLLPFMPIRAGRLRVSELRLIDTFGRVADVVPGAIHSSEAMPEGEAQTPDGPVNVFHLPPRLIPPARLHMRWLAAGSTHDESHDHPETGPICGWLVPNLLDNRVMVHTANGDAVGSIDQTGRWRPAPGSDLIAVPGDIDDRALRHVVLHLLHESDDARKEFIDAVESALECIAPESHAQHRALALLMGRPVAVVRASIRLEVLGDLPTDQSWEHLRERMEGGQAGASGLEEVRFPLRLGEHGQLDDGLVGFWIEDGDGYEGKRFYVPHGNAASPAPGECDDSIETSGGHIGLRLDDDPLHVTLLLDPRGKVHASTGILPTKVLDIPHEQYAAALHGIGVTFLTAPLLSAPGQLQLALPAEPGFEWSWLERTDKGWTETPSSGLAPAETQASLAVAQELVEGWLKLKPAPESAGEAGS